MKFKLYKDVVPEYSALNQVLYNRGIELQDQITWLNADWPQINDWRLLDEKKVRKAVELVQETMKNNKDIVLVVDCDCDGYTSAAIFINYLTYLNEDYVREHVYWVHHKGKEHGLSDVADTILDNFTNVSLVVCPDSASNDRAEHKKLMEAGISTLCLDHHEVEKDSDDALVINVQLCEYPNKALTGAGVTWQFCRAFDSIRSELGETELYANKLLDLAALGDCGDMADYREMEIRALINLGLANVHNPFFYAMSKKNDYSISKMNGLNYYSMAFYVVPFINAVVRSGTMEEKDIVFNSFLTIKAFDEVETTKRGHKGEKVKLYDEAVLTAERVKRRQTKLQDEALALFDNRIKEQKLLDNAMLFLLCEPGEVEKNIAGLIANKLQAKYQRPTAILTKSRNKDEEEYHYRGSMRNYSLSEKTNLKHELEETDLVEWVRGHANAAGMDVTEENAAALNAAMNKRYEDVDLSPIYWVDYIWGTKGELDTQKILDIGAFNIYGQEIPESYVALDRIPINASMVTLMSPDKHPTIKIQIGDISIIKFKASQEEYEKFQGENLVLSGVAKCAVNEWNGNISPQLLLEDYELDEEWIF